MKITKKEIKKFIENVENNSEAFGWRLYRCGYYIKDNDLYSFIAYHGQGLDENIYNDTYDELEELQDIINDCELLKKDKVNLCYDYIKDMIESYESVDKE